MKIFKYLYLLNGSVRISCLAPDEKTAEANARQLFGQNETYALQSFEYSHESGEYSVTEKVKKAAETGTFVVTASQKQKGDDVMENVMEAYAKGKTVTLK